VPNVVGLFLARAKARIRAANCSVGRIWWKRSRWAGRVIKQHPKAGRERPAGWKVRLVVGRL
jgi:beta-lactam-binding protein with PASTA domain